MTKREFLTKVMEMVADEEMRTFAEEEIRKLDEALEKRKEKTSQKALENMPLLDKIYNDILKEDEHKYKNVVFIAGKHHHKAKCLSTKGEKADFLLAEFIHKRCRKSHARG